MSAKGTKYDDLIDQLELADFRKELLKRRWADQTVWHGKKSGEAKKRMIRFRVVIIVGGILLPAVGFLPDNWAMIATPIISIIVAIVAGLETFFKDAEKHSQYRETAEILKIEGWSYFACTGDYRGQNNKRAF